MKHEDEQKGHRGGRSRGVVGEGDLGASLQGDGGWGTLRHWSIMGPIDLTWRVSK